MGIRVDAGAMARQMQLAGHTDWAQLEYHRLVLDGTLPLSIGGGIGQSRLCMILLHKRHIGEVQVSEWAEDQMDECLKNNIRLLQ
jgi:aspartate--ammonia ligase